MQEKDLEYFRQKKDNWTEQEIKVYWQKLRNYRELINSRYVDFIFPPFEDWLVLDDNGNQKTDYNFWKIGERVCFEGSPIFIGCVFTGRSEFLTCLFKKEVFFQSCTFKEEIEFSGCSFQGALKFFDCDFVGHLKFNTPISKSDLIIRNSNINVLRTIGGTLKDLIITDSSIENNVLISGVDTKRVQLIGDKFKDSFELNSCIIQNECEIRKVQFANSELSIFAEINGFGGNPPKMIFEDMFMTKGVIFRKTDLSGAHFKNCDVLNATFYSCFSFTHRFVLANESLRNSEDFQLLTEQYRQFKCNFELNKNWDLAAKAYRSEMLMRRYQLWEDSKSNYLFSVATFEWLLYWIYGRFSGFNQSVFTPFVIFLVSTLIVFPFYYWYVEESTGWNSFKKSISASIPYFYKAEEFLVYQEWFVSASQTLVSSILLAFFLIALRRRFKQ